MVAVASREAPAAHGLMPKTKSSGAFLTTLIQNEQVAILSFKVLFLLNVDTLAHRGAAKEY